MRLAVAVAVAAVLCLLTPARIAAAQPQPPDDEDDFTPPDRPRFGLRIGASFSNLYGNLPLPLADRTGLMAGAFVIAPVTPWLSVDACVAYAQRGATTSDSREILALDYLDAPIVVAAVFAIGETSRGRAFAGPSIAVNLDASLESASSSIDRMTTTANADLGAVVGAGIELETGGGVIVVDLRVEVGLTDIDSTETDVRHRVIGTTIGFAY